MDKIFLNKNWTMKRAGTDKIYSVEVPGSVYAHLLDIGEMKNSDIGFNDTEIIEKFDDDYIYTCKFDISDTFKTHEQIDLVCEGLDTVCDVYMNDTKLGSYENMHIKYRIPVKDVLRVGENEIKIYFYSPVKHITKKSEEQPLLENMFCMPGFSQLRKANFMFGWDWGPELPDIGIWRDIYFEGYEKARLESVYITQTHENGRVFLNIKPETEVYTDAEISFETEITTPDGEIITYTETDKQVFTYEINNPKLWYPNGYGEQNLYSVKVKMSADGMYINEKEYTIGLRTVELIENEDDYGRSFFFRVNGLDVFVKGANYIPESNFLSKRRDRMEYNLKCARDSHFNMMRIWGGGIYMDDEFYKRCSEYGIMIWQDFMYANATCVFNDELEENITAEVTTQLQRLRNYPCFAIWVGNNEVEHMLSGTNFDRSVMEREDYVKLFSYLIPKVLKKYHPEAIYKSSSPSSGTLFQGPNDFTMGDTHYWRVWFNSEPFTSYRKHFRFCSEFGVQSIPDIKTVKEFAKDDELNFFSPVMENHQKNGNGNKRIMQYIVDEFRYPKDFESLSYVSQLMQAEGVKTGVDFWRSNRGICMGSMYWQLNDCWPGITWSSIDCFGRWKALQYFAKRFYAPVVAIGYEENNEINFAVSNDTKETLDASIEWQIVNMEDEVKLSGKVSAKVKPLSAERFEKIELPQGIERRKHYIIYRLYSGSELVSEQILLLAPNKQYDFKKPDIKVDVREEKDSTVIILSSDCLARYVRLSFKDKDVIFSDNCFDLLNGTKKEIYINEKMTAVEIQKSLSVTTLVDTY